jgi:hypothetical protein
VQHVAAEGVQLDEAHSKLRPQQVEWVHTALAMGSWFLLWVDFGPRTQDTAATLIAQVVARAQQLPLFLTDGWKAYTAALLQVVGVVYRPRRRGHVGRKPKPRLVAPKTLFYAQVVKVRNKAGQVVEVSRRVVHGGPRRFGKQLRLRQLSERHSRPPFWNGGMAPCGGWSRPYGAARAVCPGAALAIGERSGSWSASTTL